MYFTEYTRLGDALSNKDKLCTRELANGCLLGSFDRSNNVRARPRHMFLPRFPIVCSILVYLDDKLRARNILHVCRRDRTRS